MELLYILLVLLVLTRLGGEIAVRLGQPTLVGELVAGIALGLVVAQSSGLFPVLSDLPENEVFLAITDLAIFFLMLFAGIELKPRELAQGSMTAFAVALGGFLVPLVSGFGFAWLFLPDSELKLVQALFVGTALAITAVPVAVKILIDLNQLDTRTGQTIVSAAIFDDVLSLVLLAVLLAVVRTGSFPGLADLLGLGARILVFFAITIALGLYLIPWLGRLLERAWIAEFELSAVLIMALTYAMLAEWLGLHFILGAFMAGLFFNRTTLDESRFEHVKTQVSGINSGFLAPVFFASIGLHLDLIALAQVPLFVMLLVLVAFGGKLLGAGGVAWGLGLGARGATAVGIAMSGRGAVELIIADIALRGGVFSAPEPPPPVVENLYAAVVVVAVATTLLTPILLRRALAERGGDTPG